ncbi:protein fuzzy homolog [Xenopus tropicalis]|uniref:Protein fuzzy homolog n=1 Tax=Xenopus tropicalis TaxID=8364 RepID=FUZZY_XENTR|nr:protein fuzzy homolog [Xenopus tropicalis]Q2HZX7.1 RecName: Full=Protein fuzzy homolog; AltName: Full=Xfy [Xenopus tropicalis]ABC86957.1 Fuzzy [Xenopus tropicalis]|eukprot:NP_001035106.1 protein fuzzy homolog [Xenopus tropicalis]
MEDSSVFLLCLAASSGVPLYSRSKGSSRQLTFSVIGSLNGVHMFASNQDVLLTSTCTENTRVAWRAFHDSITLIVMSSESGASKLSLNRLLENVFNAMVLVIGLDDLVNIKNVERLKKDLRACYRLIDSFLLETEKMGDLTQCVDCVIAYDVPILQECLDNFTQAAESNFGCLMAGGKVVVATEKWWRLSSQEVMLLCWLVASLAPHSSRDYPVYLPQGSPTVPHRLLTFQLVPGVDVCVLCGPKPSLQKVETELIERFWKPVHDPIKSCLRVQMRSFPASVPLHHGILGLLLINRDMNKSLYTVQAHPMEEMQKTDLKLTLEQRRSALRSFYTLAMSRYFPSERADGKNTLPSEESFQSGFSHSAHQCYTISSSCKCYGMKTELHLLFLLLKPEVPTFSMRSIANKTIAAFTKDFPF